MQGEGPQEMEREAIRQVLAKLNDAWLHLRGDAMTEALNGCFAEDAEMEGPDSVPLELDVRIEGLR